MKAISLGALLLLSLAAPALADDVAIGEWAYDGSGCPAGSMSMALSADEKSVARSFDAFAVGDNGAATDRKTCNLDIPVHIPSGMAAAVTGFHLRGTVTLPAGQKASLSTEMFFAGGHWAAPAFAFAATPGGKYDRAIAVPAEQQIWSGCGDDGQLRLNLGLRAKGDANIKVSIETLSLDPLAMKAC